MTKLDTTAIPTIPGFDLESFMKFTTDPTNTESVFAIQKSLVGMPNRAEMVQWVNKALAESKSFQEIYEIKYFEKLPTNEELSRTPQGSLGQHLLKHLVDNNITLDFSGIDTEVFYKTIDTPIGYLGLRGIKFHDVWHVVLGLTVSPIDEYAVLCFQLGQYQSPYHLILLASGLVHVAFYQPQNIPEMLHKMNHFYNVGKTAKFFSGFKFEQHWATPMEDVRQMLGLKASDIIR